MYFKRKCDKIVINKLAGLFSFEGDYQDKRNLTISSVIMVIGIGGGVFQLNIGSDFKFSLGGVALATIVGIVLNIILPKTPEEPAQ